MTDASAPPHDHPGNSPKAHGLETESSLPQANIKSEPEITHSARYGVGEPPGGPSQDAKELGYKNKDGETGPKRRSENSLSGDEQRQQEDTEMSDGPIQDAGPLARGEITSHKGERDKAQIQRGTPGPPDWDVYS